MATIEWRGRFAYLNRYEHGRQRRTSLGPISPGAANDALFRYQAASKGVPMESFAHMERVRGYLREVFVSTRKNAKRRGIEFGITLAHLDELLDLAGPYCSVTGVPFSLDPFAGARKRPWTPSIDRVSHYVGYVDGNVRLVCTMANFAMNQWGDEALMYMVGFATNPTKLVGPRGTQWDEKAKAVRL